MIRNIFVDMDGVLADFVGRVEELSGYSINELNAMDGDAVGDFLDIHVHHDFFYHLKPMVDFDLMHDFIDRLTELDYNVCFLTAVSSSNTHLVIHQKQRWLRKQGFDLDINPMMATIRSRDKASFASPESLLIDDRSRAVDPFRKAGGHAIKHKCASDTILKVRSLLGC